MVYKRVRSWTRSWTRSPQQGAVRAWGQVQCKWLRNTLCFGRYLSQWDTKFYEFADGEILEAEQKMLENFSRERGFHSMTVLLFQKYCKQCMRTIYLIRCQRFPMWCISLCRTIIQCVVQIENLPGAATAWQQRVLHFEIPFQRDAFRLKQVRNTMSCRFEFIFTQGNNITSILRWLETVSNTCLLTGRYNHSLSLDATIMVPKNCLTIGEHVVIIFVAQ